jgi:hypothetical protein
MSTHKYNLRNRNKGTATKDSTDTPATPPPTPAKSIGTKKSTNGPQQMKDSN